MLTATYTLVVLTVEQKNARCSLSALQNYIRTSSRHLAATDPSGLESAVDRLSKFDESCHARKVELYVIPAIRKITHEADALLAEIESLSSRGMSILRSVRETLRWAFEQGAVKIEELCESMEQYCTNVYTRLGKEEELFKIAQRVLPSDEWFALAKKFLSYDAECKQRQRYGVREAGPPIQAG